MKKRSSCAVWAALLLALAGVATAGAGPLVIRNAEDLPFHYAIDPPELAGVDAATLSFRVRLIDWFLEESTAWPFAFLEPGALSAPAALPARRHLLVGFFELPGEPDCPVGLWEVEVGAGPASVERTVRRETAILSVRSGEGKLALLPLQRQARAAAPLIRLDQRYEDWEEVPALAVFSGVHRPGSFTRQNVRGWTVLPMDASRWWQLGGTPLNEVKALADEEDVWFFVSTQSAISARLSLFLYFHDGEAQAGKNRVTLEIAPGEAGLPGVVLLWQRQGEAQAAAAPQAAGRLVSGSFFMEGRISRRMLEAALGRSGGPQASFDLTTCYFDREAAAYEEFYFTTVHLRDIPTMATR